jgi:amino acid adenylation domain-containing protein
MVLVATVKLLLHRYTGQQDIVIGFPTSGRDSPDLAGQVGCFVNMVALRSQIDAEDSVEALLAHVRHGILEAFEHQAYPFDRLVEELGLTRDLSRSPVFDVSVSLVNAERAQFRFGHVAVAVLDSGYVGAKLDLAFDFHEAADGLQLAIGYSTDLFGAERIGRMAAHYRQLVGYAVRHPDQPIGRLPLMDAAERHLVLDTFNATDRPPPDGANFVALFEAHAERAPDAPAVSEGDRLLGYGTLNRRANRLAHLLAANGIGADCMVGVHLESSVETVIGFLAILKAGGVYLPLDPSNPPERLAAMLDDARPVAILTRAELADRLSIPLECRLLFWDDALRADLTQYSEADPSRAAGPTDAAYAIYTSGSTGQPKAAVLLHRGLANVVREQVRQFDPRPGDRVVQFSALGFDASIFEMVLALGSGATLCLAEREQLLGGALVRTLQRTAITMAVLPPSTLAALPDAALPILRVLMAAGEACSAEVVRRWAPGRAFHNLYGPTEATIWASGMRCAADGGPPTIGRPIGNARLYILDRLLQPVPVGIPGELCIAGIGLARHYLNRPELTAERFVAAPFDGVPEGRLYRTGDMARWRADGAVEFLGRADAQVKLRGYRIEPGEIEAVLARHPAIRDAAVVAREAAMGQQLVAYVTQRPSDAPAGEAELRQYLRERLPDYMVPARVVRLDAMPLTPNKKVDRRALPDPGGMQGERASRYVPPRDDLEHALAALFADALRIASVGATDSLFDIGADSLNATRIVAQVHDAFRIDVSIPQLFQAATVRAFGDFLRAALPEGQADRIAAVLLRLRAMSPEEKATLLARRRA